MSTYQVAPDHIRYLLDLGSALRVRGLIVDGRVRPLDMDNRSDREFVANELTLASALTVSTEPLHAIGEESDATPTASSTLRATMPRTLHENVQALQWVRNYRYQASGSDSWPLGIARQYVDQLRDKLEVRIIGFFPTEWCFPSAANERP